MTINISVIYVCYLFIHMQTLTNALWKKVGQHEVNLQSKVLEMSYSCDDNTVGNWSVFCVPDQNKQLNQQSFDAVIMTVSTFMV